MRLSVGLLVYPGFQLLDATGPAAAFEIASRFADAGSYALTVLAKERGEVESSSGIALAARAFASSPHPDVLIVSGASGVPHAALEADVLAYVRSACGPARYVASVCSGSFVLAEAGLLDGRRATTHWSVGPEFRARYPKVRLDADRIFVREGKIWTSAGITAGIDMALALIAADLGEAVSRRTAEQLVVYRRRPGGQSQFSSLLEMEKPGGRFGSLLASARENLAAPLSVEAMAAQVAMSPRNFTRRFVEEVGTTPARAIERLRVEAARELMREGASSLERIAMKVGFGSLDGLRRACLRHYGQSPQALRRLDRLL